MNPTTNDYSAVLNVWHVQEERRNRRHEEYRIRFPYDGFDKECYNGDDDDDDDCNNDDYGYDVGDE